MLYDIKNISSSLIILQKIYIYNKFNIINFLFLTNNFFLFNDFYNFFYKNNINLNLLTLIKNTYKLKLIKNTYKFYKFFNNYRNFFFLKKYFFKNKLKFNKFLITTLNISNKKLFFSKKLKTLFNFNFYPLLFKNYFHYFFRNWNFVIGSSLSPYYWDLYAKKNWIKKKLIFLYIKNILYFRKNQKNKYFTKNKIINKKFIINNYFYFKKFKLNYNFLNYLVKIQYDAPSVKLLRTKYNWFFSKPYSFLNNYRVFKVSKNYPNYFLTKLYKNYLRIFSIFKRNNFIRNRKSNDFFFKNNNNIDNFFYFTYNNNYYLNYYSYFNNFSFFFFNNSFINSIELKKKNVKKNLKYLWFFKLLLKTKFFKKNKIFSVLKLTKSPIFYKKKTKITFLSSNYIIKRLSKRFKKFTTGLSINFFKVLKKNFNLIWYKKNVFFFNKNKNFFFFNKNKNFINLKFKFLLSKSSFYKIKTYEKKNTILINFKTSNIFNLLNKFFFISRKRNNFLLNKYGFIFLSDVFSNFNNKLIYNLKKNIYSFSYKNEIQKYTLKKYIKNNFINNFYNKKYLFLNNILIKNDKLLNNTDLSFFNNYLKKTNECLFIFSKNFFYSDNWSYFNNQINRAKINLNDESNFNIKRIKFKPGYMSLWREVRDVLKTSLSLNFKYQYKLTNYLTKYNKFIKFKTFLFTEMKLINILIKSRLFSDYNLCYLFIKNNLIYLNGFICSNSNFQIFIGDFIQMIINIKYYILFKWFLNLIFKKKNKLRKIAKKKITPFRDFSEKKRSRVLPNWILFNKNLIEDISKYIEVDYFTLSIIILYEPILWSDLNTYSLIDQKFGIINLYNWKYIT